MKEVRFAFWNINRKDLSDRVVDLTKKLGLHAILLAEADESVVLTLLGKLRANITSEFNLTGTSAKRVRLLHRLPKKTVTHIGSETHAELWKEAQRGTAPARWEG